MVDKLGPCSNCNYWDTKTKDAEKRNEKAGSKLWGTCKVGRSLKRLTTRTWGCEWWEKADESGW